MVLDVVIGVAVGDNCDGNISGNYVAVILVMIMVQ